MARACGQCGLINEGDTSDPKAACPECGTTYRKQIISDDVTPTVKKPTGHSVQKAREAIAAHRSEQSNSNEFRITVAVIVAVLAMIAYSALMPTDQDTATITTQSNASCDRNDAACAAQSIIAAIQAPCSRAIESQLKYVASWENGAFQWRFDRPMWYEPPNTLIFHGRYLVATNGFGAQMKPSYFCVTTTSGTVIKAEIHDLP